MRILLTGFEPFGGLKYNPSQLIANNIAERTLQNAQHNVIPHILPTEFDASATKIQGLIYEIQPDAIISLGVATGIGSIQLERVALNLDDSHAPDNAGVSISARPIIEGGPLAYASTLPLNLLRQALQNNHIPVHFSNHVGTYVCNHVFYVARHVSENLPNKPMCGFIHVPPMTEQVSALGPYAPHLPLETMTRAIEHCLNALDKRN